VIGSYSRKEEGTLVIFGLGANKFVIRPHFGEF